MKITQRQIRNLIQNELNESVSSERKDNTVDIDVDQILQEQVNENPDLLNEGMFSSALKALGANLVPGGRYVADYTRARGFEELESAAEGFEQRLDALESQMASLMSALGGLPRT